MILMYLFFLLILAVTDILYPFYSRKYIQFGISIPEPYVNEEILSSFRKRYSSIATIIHSIVMIVFLVTAFNITEEQVAVNFLIAMFIMGVVAFTLYFIFHLKTKRIVVEKQWFEKVTLVHVTRFESKLNEKIFAPYLFIAPMIITIAVIILTILRYDTLPDIIATHWGINGQPDAWTEKSFFAVLMMPLMLIILQFVNLAIAYGVSKASIQLTAQATDQSIAREAESRRQTQIFLVVTNICLTVLLLFLHVSTTIIKIENVSYFIVLFLLYIIVITVAVYVYARRIYKKKEQFTNINTDESIVSDDGNWKLGIFYFNKDDPGVFVEKRVGIGWTINFAHPGAYFFLFIVIVLPLLPLFFL